MLSLYLVQILIRIELQQFIDKSISINVGIFSSKNRQTSVPFLCHLGW